MKQDKQGKQFVALHDVRGAFVTASASLTSGTASELLSGDADYFLDVIEVTFANNSNATASIALKNDGSTVRTITATANGTVQLQFDAPLEQPVKNTPWNVDMEDITGTTVSIGAVFMKR